MFRKFSVSLGILLIPLICLTQNFPGGVYGADVWYKADAQDILDDYYEDYSGFPHLIERCPDEQGLISSGLLNFNPALVATDLCLQFNAPLEKLFQKSIFVVAEPEDEESYPLLSSNIIGDDFNEINGLLSENVFVIETKKGYAAKTESVFEPYQNAQVYFYSWSAFDQERKYKSYGQRGEALYKLGAPGINTDEVDQENISFAGVLPEFITFNRKLSKDEYRRIESYLSLKYGITKWHLESYVSSTNKTIWAKENNILFSHQIFGVGRDDISGLNQLQSESVHKKDFLITAIDSIMITNEELQNHTSIPDNNFLVFGNSGEAGIIDMTSPKFKRLKKVWLAQRTGDSIMEKSLEFKLNLEAAFSDETLENIKSEKEFVWMLHDVRANRNEKSDFQNNNVRFYKASSMSTDTVNGNMYAHFRQQDLKFDTDGSSLDQFTFAVGAECTLRFQPVYSCELASQSVLTCFTLSIILIGDCQNIELFDSSDQKLLLTYDTDLSDQNGNPTYIAEVCAPESYTAKLYFSDGSTEVFNYEAFPIGPYEIDLGDEIQYLPANSATISLDAGRLMPPGSTFKWYKNNEDLHYFDPVFIVTETGYFCVHATSPDGLCVVIGCVTVDSHLEVTVDCLPGLCVENSNTINLTFIEGFPPFYIEIEPDSGNHLQFHTSAESYLISNLADEFHSIRVTDAEGTVFEGSCDFQSFSGVSEVILDDEKILNSMNSEYVIDAAFLADDLTTAIFQWFFNDDPMAHNTPSIVVEAPGLYEVKVSSTQNECLIIGKQVIRTALEGEIYQLEPCSPDETFVFIDIHFGFPPFSTEIIGINGTAYSEPPIVHNGSINREVPLGNYRVTTTDDFGNYLEEELIFNTIIWTSLEEQVGAYCTAFSCVEHEDFCGLGFTLFDFHETGIQQMSLSALAISDPLLFNYSWYLDGVLISNEQSIVLERCSETKFKCEFSTLTLSVEGNSSDNKSCGYTEEVHLDPNWCLGTVVPEGYTSKVFPNPTNAEFTFNYWIGSNAEEVFNGKIEVFSLLGVLIFSDRIEGNWQYTFPYKLMSSGVYLIRTTTEKGVIKVDRVIIK